MSTRGVLVLVAATQLACGADPLPETAAEGRQPVIGGVASGDDENAVVLVRKLKPTGGYASCTGTLVAPNLAVTALHCVTPMNDTSDFECTPSGNLINSANGDGELGTPLPPSYITLHVGPRPVATPTATAVRIFTTGSTQVCRGDLALLQFEPRIEGLRLPIGVDSLVAAGHRVTVIGYGQADPGASGRQRRDEVRVTDVGIPPGGFVTDEGPCLGDSGGPAIASTGAIIGVYSRIAGSCDSSIVQNTFTYLTAYRDFVLNAFATAGAEPWLEGQPEPGTTGGSGGAAGASGAAGAVATGGVSGTGGSDPNPPRKKSKDDDGCSVSKPGSSNTTPLVALGLLGLVTIARGRRRR